MNVVVLHGEMAEKFGSEFRMDIRTAIEAYRGLAAQLPGFREYVRKRNFFTVRETNKGGFILARDALNLGAENARLHIIPEAEGSAMNSAAKGGTKLAIGIAIIGVLTFQPELIGAGALLAGTAGTASAIYLGAVELSIGLGLALGGAAMLIAPTPKFNQQKGVGEGSNSYLFGSNINPSGQGIPVPLAYGQIRVPTIAVASQIVTNQIYVPIGDVVDSEYPDYGGNAAINYGVPPLIINNTAPPMPLTDFSTLWLDSSNNFKPYKVAGSHLTWDDANASLTATGIWTFNDGRRMFIIPDATVTSPQVGDFEVGHAMSQLVWTGTQWVPF